MVAASICVPSVNPSNLLSLQEPLQDEQVGLTQASSKALPLPALRGCELWGMSFQRSVFPAALLLSHTLLLAYNDRSPGGLSSWCKIPGQGSPIWDLGPLLLGDTFAFVIILFVGPLPGGLCLDYGASLFLLPVSHFLLHIFSLEIFSSSLQVVLIEEVSINSCNFGVPVGGGEYRPFLLCHLVMPVTSFSKRHFPPCSNSFSEIFFALFLFSEERCQNCHYLEGVLISHSLSWIKNMFSNVCIDLAKISQDLPYGVS